MDRIKEIADSEAAPRSRRARVLHVSESGAAGGAETVLLNVVRGLDPARFESSVILMADGWLNDSLHKAGFPPVVLRSRRSYDLGFVLRLSKLIREHKIDLIHAHLPDSNAYACLAGLLTGRPVIATYHGMLPAQSSWSPGRIKLALVGRLARRIVAVSDALNKHLVAVGRFPASKLKTIYNGVDWLPFERDLDRTALRRDLNIPLGAPVVGIVANLKPAKGYPYFIRAAAQIARTVPESVFLIVGCEEGELKGELQTEILNHHLESRVRFLGLRDDVADLLRIMDVFVLSSISEGMSIATVEACAAGTPVVVTRSGGPEEIVHDGETGMLVPPANAEALALGAISLLKDRERAMAMAAKARSFVRDRFSLASMLRGYESIYEECLTDRGTRS